MFCQRLLVMPKDISSMRKPYIATIPAVFLSRQRVTHRNLTSFLQDPAKSRRKDDLKHGKNKLKLVTAVLKISRTTLGIPGFSGLAEPD